MAYFEVLSRNFLRVTEEDRDMSVMVAHFCVDWPLNFRWTLYACGSMVSVTSCIFHLAIQRLLALLCRAVWRVTVGRKKQHGSAYSD